MSDKARVVYQGKTTTQVTYQGKVLLVVGTKLYGVCERCRRLVRMNKPLIGDLHLCEVTQAVPK